MSTFAFVLGWSLTFFVVAALIADFVLRRTVLDRNLYATGGNLEVARLVNINTTYYKIGAFAAVAGIFVMADLQSNTTSIGSSWEPVVIAGIVVGVSASLAVSVPLPEVLLVFWFLKSCSQDLW